MQNFNVLIDAEPYCQIAIAPSILSASSMATKQYRSKEELAADMQHRLGYTNKAVVRFFTNPEQFGTMVNHPLSEEDAVYFGWLREYNKRLGLN